MIFRLLVVVLLFGMAPLSNADLGQPGPFAVGSRRVSITRPDASVFTALVYYPATVAGGSAPFNGAASPAPVVSFGHGFATAATQYASTLAHLASHGYIAIASESEQQIIPFPDHGKFAADLSRCLTYLEQQSTTPGSWVSGGVDPGRFGLSGHSMGGGCSLVAAAADPRVRTLVALAPAETNVSAIGAAGTLTVPVALLCGDADTITPSANHGRRMYDALRGPRQLPTIRGGYHCGFIDNGMFGCDGPGAGMTRAVQLASTRRFLTAWFNLHLRGDPSGWRGVWGPSAPGDSLITLIADARATLAGPVGEVAAVQGRPVVVRVTLTNTGPASAFALEAEGLAWPIGFDPSVTPVIGTGGSLEIAVTVVPPPASAPIAGEALLSVRRLADGASRAWTTVRVRARCRADVNGDGFVDFFDFDGYASCFEGAACPPGEVADFNGDGFVDFFDFDEFVAAFEAGC